VTPASFRSLRMLRFERSLTRLCCGTTGWRKREGTAASGGMTGASDARSMTAPSQLKLARVLQGAGGRRCQHEGCTRAAVTEGTSHCVSHCGGKRWKEKDCTKACAYRERNLK
jgi:hypothetical protein